MQEQHPYKTTPDQAWNHMGSILDREMPVPQHSRRFLVWWFAAASVIGIIGLTFFLQTGDASLNNLVDQTKHSTKSTIISSKEIDTTTSEPSKPSEPTEPTEPTEPSESFESSESIGSTISPKKSENYISEPVTDNIQNHARDKNKKQNLQHDHDGKSSIAENKLLSNSVNTPHFNNNPKRSQEQSAEPVTENKTAKFIVESNESKSTINQNNVTTGSTPVLNSDDQASTLMLREIETINYLPTLTSVISSEENFEITGIEPGNINKINRTKKLITPHIYAAGIAGSQNGLGLSLGAGVDVNISSRLSFNTSLGYQAYKPDAISFALERDFLGNAESTAVLQADAANGIGTYIPSEVVNKTAGYNIISPFVESVKQWQLSVGCNYDLSSRFSLHTGVAFGFGITATSAFPIVSYSYPAADVNIENSFESFDILRNNTTSIYAGAGYKIGRKMDLFTSWTHSFDPYLLNEQSEGFNTSKRTDYIRGLSVGIKYTL